MKSVYALAAFVALVAAQDSGLPSCAIPCIREATESETDCTFGDYSCSCEPTNNAAIRSAATGCVVEACGADVALNEVVPATEALCENPPTSPEEPAETTTAASEPTPSAPAEETDAPESAYPVPEASSAPAPEASSAPAPEHSSTPVKPEEPTHAGNTTEPEPTHVEVDGAASVGFMGVAAMVGLAALAL